ncbi:MAG: gliding motility-associated C-terminal domain-containing protein [Spirosomataceae bacterium]
MKKLLLLCWLGCVLSAQATHIVGGEIGMLYVPNQPNYNYVVSLNLYFDGLNGNPAAEDPDVTIFVFSKRDNIRIGSFSMPMVANMPIRYRNPECVSAGGLRTLRMEYSLPVYFNPDAFTDPLGYYMVWERCCRNNVISNIVQPGAAGMTFYLEFPPLKVDGKNNFNSSPQYAEVKGDYICRNSPFQFDFSATDPDGDSLRYSLVTPYNGYSSQANPRPANATPSSSYPTVRWNPGYGVDNQIPGSPPLRINPQTGELSVVATDLGLFVFSVQVEEFRKGKRIGLVRRDFQLKVIDCPSNAPPKLFLREGGKTKFYNTQDTLVIKANGSTCLTLLAADSIPNETLTVSLKALSGSLPNLALSPSSRNVAAFTDTLRSALCLDACAGALLNGKVIELEATATDNGCPVPLSGRLRIKVRFEQKADRLATIKTDLPNNKGQVMVGDTLRFTVTATDLDNDSLSTSARGSLGSGSFSPRKGLGKVSIPVTYIPTCSDANKTNTVTFLVSQTTCGVTTVTDSVQVQVNVTSVNSQRPKVSTNLPGNATEVVIDISNPPTIRFDVSSKDPDNDPITLKGTGKNFDLKKVGVNWNDKSGRGALTSPFLWTPTCDLLGGEEKKTFEITFTTEDNSCSPNRLDTVTVKITLVNLLANFTFEVTNVFTPNNDGKNDYFSVTNLPADGCNEKFEGVSIYNRWGALLFEDTRRDFRWDGSGAAAGEYFYLIRFTKHQYKGPVTLLR